MGLEMPINLQHHLGQNQKFLLAIRLKKEGQGLLIKNQFTGIQL